MRAILPASFECGWKREKISPGGRVHCTVAKDPRIIEIDQFKVEVVPEGHFLLIFNVDRPGVIGTVGQVLGDHQINIARMQCSREERGGKALLIFGLDAPLPMRSWITITNQQAHPLRQGRRPVERLVERPASRPCLPFLEGTFHLHFSGGRSGTVINPCGDERPFFLMLPDAFGISNSRLLAVLARGGYEEIIFPLFEYLDVLAPGLEAGTDRESVINLSIGRQVVLTVAASRCDGADRADRRNGHDGHAVSPATLLSYLGLSV